MYKMDHMRHQSYKNEDTEMKYPNSAQGTEL